MPSEHYKNTFALSFSGMKALRRNPQYFWTWHHADRKEGKGALALGTLVHMLVLEPHKEKDLAIWTGKVRNGKVWDQFEVENQGRMIVKPDELAQAKAMRDAIKQNPLVAAALKQQGHAELEFHGTDPQYGCPVKCAFDWITDDYILDFKKTGESIEDFEMKSIWNYLYHVQMAFYLRLAEVMDGKKRTFAWVVVEDDEPHATMMITPHEVHFERGNAMVERMLQQFSECWTAQAWPGYSGHIKQAEVPEWILRRQG